MDLELLEKGLDYAKKKRKWAIVLGFTFYGAYRVYNLPSFVNKRKRLFKLFTALISVAELVSDSADAIGILSKDLKHFLRSDSDQIPQSFKQLSKIAQSDELSGSLTRITRGLAVGILSGYQDQMIGDSLGGEKCFSDRVFDKVFSDAGSGFASVVVGSFAKNLVMALFSEWQQSQGFEFDQCVRKGVEVVCISELREMIGDFIRVFVSTALTVYLDKTMNVNAYGEFFSGLTNPKHEARVRDMFVSVCNGAVETCLQTSYDVWTKNSKMNSSFSKIDYEDSVLLQGKRLRGKNQERGLMRGMMSNALARNRRFVLDVTGIVTFETVRSFLEFLLEKMLEVMKRSVDVIQQEVVDRGVETIRYASGKGKSSAVTTLCLSLCLNILNSPWILAPQYKVVSSGIEHYHWY